VKRIAIALLFLAGCPSPVIYDYSKEPDPRRSEFVIGVSDQLRITVWKNPELSAEGRVRPDGSITMPLIGDIVAAGKTGTQLKNEITQKLASYVRDQGAVVSVAVVDVQSYRFTVSGNVERAGSFTSKNYVTVQEAVAMAGGINRFGSTDGVVLVRTWGGGTPRRIPIDYAAVVAGTRPEANIVILPGDTIIVP
jgi:polysaccharide biosynthesis/export protein